jgi:hypothetical protein
MDFSERGLEGGKIWIGFNWLGIGNGV